MSFSFSIKKIWVPKTPFIVEKKSFKVRNFRESESVDSQNSRLSKKHNFLYYKKICFKFECRIWKTRGIFKKYLMKDDKIKKDCRQETNSTLFFRINFHCFLENLFQRNFFFQKFSHEIFSFWQQSKGENVFWRKMNKIFRVSFDIPFFEFC